MTTDICPCGSGAPAAACCARWFDGTPAPTALALMKSRYAAYVRGEVDYLIATHAPDTRGDLDREALARYSRETTWLGLEIVATEKGGEADATGVVEFIARGSHGGQTFAQRERSRFRRDRGGAWLYVDGVTPPERRAASANVGRNDPCPCGSGMKYKRCHGL